MHQAPVVRVGVLEHVAGRTQMLSLLNIAPKGDVLNSTPSWGNASTATAAANAQNHARESATWIVRVARRPHDTTAASSNGG